MSRINTKERKRFHLYDEGFFDIDSGTKLDKAKMKTDNPTINFVGRANANNGVTTTINEIKDLKPYPAGYMTLSLGGEYLGSCFIQEKPFYTSQNVVVLKPKGDMSFYVKQFISVMVFKEGRTFYKAFVDELNRHIKKDFSILIPVDGNGNPDREYMENYMKNIEEKCKNILEELKATINISKKNMDISGWKEFRVGDLFDICSPSPRSQNNYDEGEIAFVASGDINNGILKYCTPKNDEKLDEGNCITVSPVDGSSFYQENDFLGRGGAGSSIMILRNENLNKFCGLFIAGIIRKSCNFTYNDMGNKEKLKNLVVKFPVDSEGNPDRNHMENYIKNIMEKNKEKLNCFELDFLV